MALKETVSIVKRKPLKPHLPIKYMVVHRMPTGLRTPKYKSTTETFETKAQALNQKKLLLGGLQKTKAVRDITHHSFHQDVEQTDPDVDELWPVARLFKHYVKIVNHTVKTKQKDQAWLKSIYTYWFETKVDLSDARKITVKHLEDYARYAYETLKKHQETIAREMVTIKHCFNEAARLGIIKDSPARHYRKFIAPREDLLNNHPKAVSQVKALWTDDNLRQMLEQSIPWVGRILYVLWETGARPGELTRINVGDVDFTFGLIRNITSIKGGKKRVRNMVLSPSLVSFLRAEIARLSDLGLARPTDPLLVNGKDKRFDVTRFSEHVKRAKRRMGLSHLVPYGIRHTFGTELVHAGMNLQHVGSLMGHAKTTTTEIYVRPNAQFTEQMAARSGRLRLVKEVASA
jgi:site-specific recombinase XerD